MFWTWANEIGSFLKDNWACSWPQGYTSWYVGYTSWYVRKQLAGLFSEPLSRIGTTVIATIYWILTMKHVIKNTDTVSYSV